MDPMDGQVDDPNPLGEGPAPDSIDLEEKRRQFEERVADLEDERRAAEEEGDQAAEASALRKLGDLQRAMGLAENARESYARARYLYQAAGNGQGAAALLASIGNLEARMARYEAAARCFEESRELYHELSMPGKEAQAMLSEGDCQLKLGQSGTATQMYSDAGTMFGKIDDTLGQAHTSFRLGMMAVDNNPAEAEEHLELAERLYGDHVARDVPQQDVPLPNRVSDSRRYQPFVMQRVCLRERQALGFGGAAGGSAKAAAGVQRRARFAPAEAPAATSSLNTWVGGGMLALGAIYLLFTTLSGSGAELPGWLQGINDAVPLTNIIHVAIAILGAAAGMTAAHQLGIHAPVVLLALGIAFAAISHEVSQALFVGLPTGGPAIDPISAELNEDELQALRRAKAASAKLILDGRDAAAIGDPEGARQRLRKAAEIAERNVDRIGHARALEALLAVENQYGSVEDRMEVAHELFESISGTGRPGEREAVETLVALAARLGDPVQLRDAHTKLLGYFERIDDLQGTVTALLALAAIDRDTGDFERAYGWYDRAHRIYQSLRDEQGQVGTLLAMGEIDTRLGRQRRAYGHYYHAFAMYREMGDRGGQAAMLLHLGALDETGERYEEASAAFRQSKKLYSQIEDRNGEAQASLRFGATQAAHGNQRQARNAYRRALELFQELGNRGGTARVHLGLGHLARKAGADAEASAHYERARSAYAEVGDRRGQLASLREIGLIARDDDADPRIETTVDEIDRVARQASDPSARGELLLSAGDIVAALDRPANAAAIYRQALEIFENLGDDSGRRAARERLELITAAG